jgi:predicted alpha/beta superfamily hydrolase
MKKNLSLILIAFISLQFVACSQKQDNKDIIPSEIVIGIKDSLYSETLEEQREIWIHVPESDSDQKNFPVLFVLDGRSHFESLVGMMNYNVLMGISPKMIIVAIPNTNRYKDLTTSHVGDANNPSGGAGNFIKFLENELIPFIDNKYPTINYRTFFGHSLGGLVVLNTLLEYPHLFNNYLAIDPSLSWDNQKLLKKARQIIDTSEYDNKSLYVAIANTLKGDMDFKKAKNDTTPPTLHLRSIFEFSVLAESNDKLVSKWKYYPNENHGTLPIVAEHDALRFMFSWYNFEYWSEFYTSEPTLTGEELANLIVSHYEKISTKLGHTVSPKEDEMNRIAYMFLNKLDYERAYPFFKLNIRNYPESANAYDSMGDYYLSISDSTNAIRYFSKSLEFGGVNGTEEKLNKLKNK